MKSSHVISICGSDHNIPEQILDFVMRHCFCMKIVMRFQIYSFHCDEYNNCSCGGSNNAIKSGAAAVVPGHNPCSSGKRLHF